MTKTQFRKNYRTLVKSTTKMLKAYEQAALDSGAFSLDEARGSFDIPKNVLTAALMDVVFQWSPQKWNSVSKDRTMVKNIRAMTYPNWSGL